MTKKGRKLAASDPNMNADVMNARPVLSIPSLLIARMTVKIHKAFPMALPSAREGSGPLPEQLNFLSSLYCWFL